LPNNRLSDRVKEVINRGEYGILERLAQAMKHAGYTQGRLAKDVGMAQSSVNKLLKDANGSRKTVEIASVLGVRRSGCLLEKGKWLPVAQENRLRYTR
jgi:DNA-binding transcriptional regulator LsrR (DeoR family)